MSRRAGSVEISYSPVTSVDDIQLRPGARGGTVRFGVVRHVVAHARAQREAAAIREPRFELAFEAQQEVPLRAPVIGRVSRGVLEHAHAHVTEAARAPARLASDARMRGGFHLAPVDGAEWQVADLHRRPASTSVNSAVSTLPPVTVSATRWPASDARSRQ